jgi:hypothetical protein
MVPLTTRGTTLPCLPLELMDYIIDYLSVWDLLNITEISQFKNVATNTIRRRINVPDGVDVIAYTNFLFRAPLPIILHKLRNPKAKNHERISITDITNVWPFLRSQTFAELTGPWNLEKIRALGYRVSDRSTYGMLCFSVSQGGCYTHTYSESILTMKLDTTHGFINYHPIRMPKIQIFDELRGKYLTLNKNKSYLHLITIDPPQ